MRGKAVVPAVLRGAVLLPVIGSPTKMGPHTYISFVDAYMWSVCDRISVTLRVSCSLNIVTIYRSTHAHMHTHTERETIVNHAYLECQEVQKRQPQILLHLLHHSLSLILCVVFACYYLPFRKHM